MAGKLGGAQLIHSQTGEREQEGIGLGRRLQLAAIAVDVFFLDQTFDGGCASGGCSQATRRHGIAQFFIIDQFARPFHGGEQGGFGEARWWPGGQRLDLDIIAPDPLVLLHRHELRATAFFVFLAFFVEVGPGFFAIDGQPAGCDQYLALAPEGFAFDTGDARGDVVFGCRIEDRQKPLDDEVVEFLFWFGKMFGRLRRRHDGEVVADFGVIENALVRVNPAIPENFARERRVGRLAQCLQCFPDVGDVVLGQTARIGTWVSQYLVLFVQGLREPQRGLGGKAEAAIGLALQGGQVEQLRRELGRRLAFFFDSTMLAQAFLADGLGAGFVPEAFCTGMFVLALLEFLVEPAAPVSTGHSTEFGLDFPVVTRLEAANLVLAFDENGQGRRLHTAHRCLVKAAFLGIKGCHGACAIDADEPVRFGAAACGVCQR